MIFRSVQLSSSLFHDFQQIFIKFSRLVNLFRRFVDLSLLFTYVFALAMQKNWRFSHKSQQVSSDDLQHTNLSTRGETFHFFRCFFTFFTHSNCTIFSGFDTQFTWSLAMTSMMSHPAGEAITFGQLFSAFWNWDNEKHVRVDWMKFGMIYGLGAAVYWFMANKNINNAWNQWNKLEKCEPASIFCSGFWVGSMSSQVHETTKGLSRSTRKLIFMSKSWQLLTNHENIRASETTKWWRLKQFTVGWSSCEGFWAGKLFGGVNKLEKPSDWGELRAAITWIKSSLSFFNEIWIMGRFRGNRINNFHCLLLSFSNLNLRINWKSPARAENSQSRHLSNH
jgi:hypothetical protein